MLEEPAALRAWALDELPMPRRCIAARELVPHRKLYLIYEGPIRGMRGWVRRRDRGQYAELRRDADSVTLRMAGAALWGIVTLDRTSDNLWQFRYCPSGFSAGSPPVDGEDHHPQALFR